MTYVVLARGRPIGRTDLAFVRIGPQFCSGWFHPNDDGERLMPVIAAPLPAMRAYLHRRETDRQGAPIVQPALQGSTLFADLAEAFQHLDSFDLELRREDGTLVRTSMIGLQDNHQLLALAEEWLREPDETGSVDVIETFEEEADDDATDLLESPPAPWTLEPSTPWTMDDIEPDPLPRYQIHVELAVGESIPGQCLDL